MFSSQMLQLFAEGIVETLYMTLTATFFSYAFGLPLGIILNITDKNGICPNRTINVILGVVVNMLRSIPFLILMVWILPFTRFVVGTTLGSTATIVPLVVAAAPYVARMVESSLQEVDAGVIEAAQSMGSNSWQIISKVLLPEAKPSLIVGATISITTILGYSAMAGFLGGGGLGAIATNYGFYRYQDDVMTVTVILLIIVVQIFQEIGMRGAKILDKRIK